MFVKDFVFLLRTPVRFGDFSLPCLAVFRRFASRVLLAGWGAGFV